MRILALLKSLIFTTALLYSTYACAEEKNGFILDHGLIPSQQIFKGGPAKDGIPAIDQPVFTSAHDEDVLQPDDRILGIVIDGVARAYPISILNWHEIVNDSIGDTAYTISYCPLCGTGVAFSRKVKGQTLRFGVSGLLYNSDVLLYDHESESLWSQILGKAVTGKHKGTKLSALPLSHTSWPDWKSHHPLTQVLSRSTGYTRNYDKDPYSGYETSRNLYFPVQNKAPVSYHPKERVLGLTSGESYKAYPFIELNKNNQSRFSDSFNGKTYLIYWNKNNQSGHITDIDGTLIPVIQGYWFAWFAFHPDTLVFTTNLTQ